MLMTFTLLVGKMEETKEVNKKSENINHLDEHLVCLSQKLTLPVTNFAPF